MKFLTVSTEIEKKYFLLQTVVVKKFIFLEFLNQKNSQMNTCLGEEKLFLIRQVFQKLGYTFTLLFTQ